MMEVVHTPPSEDETIRSDPSPNRSRRWFFSAGALAMARGRAGPGWIAKALPLRAPTTGELEGRVGAR